MDETNGLGEQRNDAGLKPGQAVADTSGVLARTAIEGIIARLRPEQWVGHPPGVSTILTSELSRARRARQEYGQRQINDRKAWLIHIDEVSREAVQPCRAHGQRCTCSAMFRHRRFLLGSDESRDGFRRIESRPFPFRHAL